MIVKVSGTTTFIDRVSGIRVEGTGQLELHVALGQRLYSSVDFGLLHLPLHRPEKSKYSLTPSSCKVTCRISFSV